MPRVPREGHRQPEGGLGALRRSSRCRLRARPALPAAGILPAARVCPACLLRAGPAPARFPRDSPGASAHGQMAEGGLAAPRMG